MTETPWRWEHRTGRFARRHRRGPRAGVAIVAAFMHVVGARNLAADGALHVQLSPWLYAILLVGPIALLGRRRHPLVVFVVAAAASIGFALFAEPRWPYAVAPIVALFALARAGRLRDASVAAAVSFASYLLLIWWAPSHLPSLSGVVTIAAGLYLAVFLGTIARSRSEHLAEMAKARAERARAEQEQERRQASEERLRVARELHDVLGHHLSLINVQAGVGLHLMDTRPQQAREALAAIKSASAEALREVRAVLDVLRTEGESAPRQPLLGLSRLDDLTAGAGLPVRVTTVGDPRPLPAEVDRAAYRIVQEALTNVRNHAPPGATATVTVDHRPEALYLTIHNDDPTAARPSGAGTSGLGGGTASGAATVSAVATSNAGSAAGADAAESAGAVTSMSTALGLDASVDVDATPGRPIGECGGSGIAGMRARAEGLGGVLEAGPEEGGFLVSVTLPVPAGTTPAASSGEGAAAAAGSDGRSGAAAGTGRGPAAAAGSVGRTSAAADSGGGSVVATQSDGEPSNAGSAVSCSNPAVSAVVSGSGSVVAAGSEQEAEVAADPSGGPLAVTGADSGPGVPPESTRPDSSTPLNRDGAASGRAEGKDA